MYGCVVVALHVACPMFLCIRLHSDGHHVRCQLHCLVYLHLQGAVFTGVLVLTSLSEIMMSEIGVVILHMRN